jgi:hypothetical protein
VVNVDVEEAVATGTIWARVADQFFLNVILDVAGKEEGCLAEVKARDDARVITVLENLPRPPVASVEATPQDCEFRRDVRTP